MLLIFYRTKADIWTGWAEGLLHYIKVQTTMYFKKNTSGVFATRLDDQRILRLAPVSFRLRFDCRASVPTRSTYTPVHIRGHTNWISLETRTLLGIVWDNGFYKECCLSAVAFRIFRPSQYLRSYCGKSSESRMIVPDPLNFKVMNITIYGNLMSCTLRPMHPMTNN